MKKALSEIRAADTLEMDLIEKFKREIRKEENNITLEELKECLRKLPEKDKFSVFYAWIEKDNNILEIKDLKEVLKLLPEAIRLNLATSLIESQNNDLTLENIREVLECFSNFFQKMSVASAFAKKGYLEELLEIMPNDPEITYTKLDLVKETIRESAEELKFDFFVKAAKKNIFQSLYNHQKIQKEYSELNLPISSLPTLCTQLHPNNERLQAELFSEFIKSESLQDKSILKNFVNSLQKNEQALKIISLTEDYPSIALTELEILDLSSQRLSRKYQSISQSLSQKTLPDSLNKKDRKTVLDLFENSADLGSKSLADLFSYYDIKDALVDFKSVTKPKILFELTGQYSPDVNSPYIAKEEYEKLQQLFNSVEHEESNLELPKVEVLANYLKSKVEIPTVDPEQFQFGRSEYFVNDSDSLAEITETFKNLLRAEVANLQQQDVTEFFKKALKLEDEINPNNQDNLLSLFKDRRNDLAFLLQKDEGLDQLYSIIHTLGDGCVANIANHVNNALYQSLINDSCDQALYGVFHEKISTPILNSEKDLLGPFSTGEQVSILENPFIRQNLISPNGLIKALEERFYKDGKVVKPSWDFIKEKLGEELQAKLCVECNYDNAHLAKIAAYIILKETVPEILKSKYLKTFKESFGLELKEAKKALIEEALNKRKIPPSEPSPSPSSEVRQASNLSSANTSCCIIS